MKYKAIPKAGKTCTFYDAGKRSDSRTYKAEVLCIMSKKEVRSIKFPQYLAADVSENNTNLYDIWSKAILRHPDWYAKDTDCFIECAIPNYDTNNIWFARSADGGWYSMDIQNCWQHGELVVD